MSDLEQAIATQRANLKRRRQWMRERQRELRRDARHYCTKPSTLVGAFLTGTALGALYPPRGGDRHRPAPDNGGGGAMLRHHAVASLQLLLVNTIVSLFTRPRPDTESQRIESSVDS